MPASKITTVDILISDSHLPRRSDEKMNEKQAEEKRRKTVRQFPERTESANKNNQAKKE